MPVALEQFVKQIADSGVIAPGKLENFIPPKAFPKDTQELARQLVQSKHLTKFQAQEIYLGRQKSLILGNYTILDKIGAGGMGQVFKAEHRRMHRLVAIKMLPAATMKDAAAAARFQREVEAAAKLSHPNIVAAHDADEANGVHFLVMEYAEGSDLSALVKKNGPLQVAKAINYILQAARGLEFAHGEGVVHRDIKPANLLLDKKETVKILDMGLARIEGGGDTATQAELTGTGAVLGTVDYMAPEQARDTKHADARADIYSLGCSLLYLLTGKPLYEGETITAKLLAHQFNPIPELRSIRDDVPTELETVYQKMVAKKVGDRYQTMSEVVAALEQCSSGQQTSVSIQQSVDTNLDADVLTFLRDAPPHASHVQKKAKKAVPAKTAKKVASSKSGKDNKKLILGAVGGFLGLLIVTAVIFKLRTKDGTLVVEVNQPDAVVQVLDADGKVEISQPGGKTPISISVDPGKHRLKVEKDGFKFFAQDFEMDSRGERSIKATLIPLGGKPVATGTEKALAFKTPGFDQWVKTVAALPAEQQVEAVSKKLVELNPGFDGKETHKIEGVVTEVQFFTDNLTDISPMRALVGLQRLTCHGSGPGKGILSDLLPLKGMPLTHLDCAWTNVTDLSPLRGMRLTDLNCAATQVSDLSALEGMPLTRLACGWTRVSDFSPLAGMSLVEIAFTLNNATKGIDVIRQMKSLMTISTSGRGRFTADEFWKKYDAGEFGKPDAAAANPDHKPITNINDPAFQQWMKTVAALPAEAQVDAVAKKLQELNPGFDGKEGHKIEGGMVTELRIASIEITDISPVRALAGLKKLEAGAYNDLSHLSDLSPLQGMPLTILSCTHSLVSDLSPLRGMPLKQLACGYTQVSNLAPLEGIPLTYLGVQHTPVSDLSSIKGIPLTRLDCDNTQVFDLSVVRGMALEAVTLTPRNITKGLEIIRQMKSITMLGIEWTNMLPAEEFWRKYDAGDFGKPTQSAKPITNINDPAFQQWMKTVAALPAEDQVKAVVKKLKELNPGFDGKVTHKIEGGVVTEMTLIGDEVADISPVRALVGLKKYYGSRIGKLSDVSPLKGMPLTELYCSSTQVADLSPLKGMPLTILHARVTKVSDLSPLKGMPLNSLQFSGSPVSDLTPIKGMPLTDLECDNTPVFDLTPLQGMDLTVIRLTPRNITRGMDIIRQMKSLKVIGFDWNGRGECPPAEFWKKYDAGEFNK